MSFNVNLYTHSKRDNSTKRPSVSGTTYACVMKHGCGILNPTITLDLGLSSDPSQYNYAYIPAFERYYFIEEWYFEERLWTAQLKVDVLATYKSEIGDSNLYVLRSANESDGDIIDTLYPCETGSSFDSSVFSNPWQGEIFVVGIVNKNGQFGSLNYYAMTRGQLANMCTKMCNSDDIINTIYHFDPTEISPGLQLSLVDPLQYIKTCVMIPVDGPEISDAPSVGNIPVFNWDSESSGKGITTHSRIYKNYSFTIKKHPQTNSRGNYVNSAPYTSITLTIPPFGCIDIDTSVTCNASTLNVEVEVDPTNGKGILIVECNGIILNRLESQIGVPISLSSVTRDYVGAISSTVGSVAGGVGSLMTGNVGDAFSSVASGIGNAIGSLMPRAQTVGTTGAFVANRGSFRLDHQFMRPVADDPVHNGRPLCKMRTLKNLGGYMLIQDGDVTINGTATEDQKIREYLESGFYYE